MEFPGVGRYTAAAVASIAYGEPVPVVDGNVKRVLDRIAGCELNEQGYWNSAGDLLDHNHPGEFNQAMMEFGATLCLPRNPLCRECPVIELCASRGAREQQKQERRRKATLKYALVQREGKILLQRRPADSSLMPGMWELPEIRNTRREPLVTLRHSITDTDYTVLVYDDERGAAADACWIPLRNVTRLPLTGLTAKILRAHRLLPA
jgi:A/G-specific adenine glycosylase